MTSTLLCDCSPEKPCLSPERSKCYSRQRFLLPAWADCLVLLPVFVVILLFYAGTHYLPTGSQPHYNYWLKDQTALSAWLHLQKRKEVCIFKLIRLILPYRVYLVTQYEIDHWASSHQSHQLHTWRCWKLLPYGMFFVKEFDLLHLSLTTFESLIHS